jgi:hypothetical protein
MRGRNDRVGLVDDGGDVAIVWAPSPGRVRQAVGEGLSGGDGH